jgi:hypothetical protein
MDFGEGFLKEYFICLMRRQGNVPCRVQRDQQPVDNYDKEDDLSFFEIEVSIPLKD